MYLVLCICNKHFSYKGFCILLIFTDFLFIVFNSVFQNAEFHQIIEELVTWLEKTENVIRQAEPVDLTDKLEVIEAKYTKFRVSSSIRILYKAVFICILLNTCSCQYLKHYSFFHRCIGRTFQSFCFYMKLLN